MISRPAQLTLSQWQERYTQLKTAGLQEPAYGGPLLRHADQGDKRLACLKFDNSPAALHLWNFLLTEEDRLRQHRANGKLIIGTMKDLGTVPILVDSFDEMVAFYPDGAWWTPCLKQMHEGLFEIAAQHGLDESFCPVRAMVGAFVNGKHFPIPDALICSVGATCDDFSVAAQRVESLGHPVFWWEMPHRRRPSAIESSVVLPCGFNAPQYQIDHLRRQLQQIQHFLEHKAGRTWHPDNLRRTIRNVNHIRRRFRDIQQLCFTAPVAPMGSLELLIAEMLMIHFCSDMAQTQWILEALLSEIRTRIDNAQGILPADAARIFWVNPVADLYAMNLLEECGGRLCGTEFLFAHALEPIPDHDDPLTALAQMALSDPMAGSAFDRAELIARKIRQFGSEAVVISRIPGASHCAFEGRIISQWIQDYLGLPTIEIEVPTLTDSYRPSLQTRLEALIETVKTRRKS